LSSCEIKSGIGSKEECISILSFDYYQSRKSDQFNLHSNSNVNSLSARELNTQKHYGKRGNVLTSDALFSVFLKLFLMATKAQLGYNLNFGGKKKINEIMSSNRSKILKQSQDIYRPQQRYWFFFCYCCDIRGGQNESNQKKIFRPREPTNDELSQKEKAQKAKEYAAKQRQLLEEKRKAEEIEKERQRQLQLERQKVHFF
ncbi:hypothetical protein RFI_16252, partial [Reticulomyxa filosa]